jgi:gas vesicle protein
MTDDRLGADEPPDLPGDGSEGRMGGFAGGVVFGAILGAGLALLFAPDRGDKTRSRLREDLIRRRRLIKGRMERARDAL